MDQTDTARLRRTPLLAAVAGMLLLLAACGGGTASSAPAATSAPPDSTESGEASPSAEASEEPDGDAGTVSITGTSFGASEISVAAGESVAFTNNSSLPHTVTEGTNGNAAADARFNESLPAGTSVDITFDEAGDYEVTCLFHANMNMVVHVE